MIDLVPSAWALLSAFLVFCFGAAVTVWAGKILGVGSRRVLQIYFWHTVFCILYAMYIDSNSGDASVYYYKALDGDVTFKAGSGLVSLITYPLVSVFGLGFLATSLCFNIAGAIGLVACDVSFRESSEGASARVKRLARILIFLPSMSFWSAGIGKDALAFLSVGLALWSSMLLPKRAPGMVLAVLCMLAVRPHIAGVMILALAGSIVVLGRISMPIRIVLGVASMAGAAWLIPFAVDYVGLGGDLDGAEVQEYIAKRQSVNLGGGSSVDISSMSFPMQVFTYVFRPLPFEAHNASSLASSIENVLLLAIFFYGLLRMLPRWRILLSDGRAFLWFYAGACWVLCALTTANLGIAVRQKWMFVPMLMALMLQALAWRRGSHSRIVD